MSNRIDQLSITPTIGRQTQKNEFGEVLKGALEKGAGLVSNALMSAIPGGAAVSAAVSQVTNMVNNAPRGTASAGAAASASGVTNVGGQAGRGVNTIGGGSATTTALNDPTNMGPMNDTIGQMRAETERSFQLQVAMQNESREFNTVSNVIKVRHDSAKAAINNIR